MPFKSEAQRKRFGVLLKEGTITQKTFDEFNRNTPMIIPNRIHPKKMGTIPRIKKMEKMK